MTWRHFGTHWHGAEKTLKQEVQRYRPSGREDALQLRQGRRCDSIQREGGFAQGPAETLREGWAVMKAGQGKSSGPGAALDDLSDGGGKNAKHIRHL